MSMDREDKEKAKRIRDKIDRLGVPSVSNDDITWILLKFFELLEELGMDMGGEDD